MKDGREDGISLFYEKDINWRETNDEKVSLPFRASDSDGMILFFEGVEGPHSSIRW